MNATTPLNQADSRPDEMIRDPAIVPSSISRQVFRPERIFLIAGHGQETRQPITANSKYFRTTIQNAVVVETEFPRVRCPPNTFMVNTSQAGVGDTPNQMVFQSLASLISHRNTTGNTPDGKIHVPDIAASYELYKDQLYELGNETFDKTHKRQVALGLNVETAPFMYGEAGYFNYEYAMNLANSPNLPVYNNFTKGWKEKLKAYRFRSHGPIANTTNIQNQEDTFFFFAPNATVTTNTILAQIRPGDLEQEFYVLGKLRGLMPSGAIPLASLTERLSKEDYFVPLALILPIFRDHTLGDLERNLTTYVTEYPQARKERFLVRLTHKETGGAFTSDPVLSTTGDLNTRITTFLMKQIDNMRKHWVWGVSLTEDEFQNSTFFDLINKFRTTEELVNRILDVAGTDEPLLIISYHCRSFLISGERANRSAYAERIRQVVNSGNLNNNQKNEEIARLVKERNSSEAVKKEDKAWQNVIRRNPQTGNIAAQKLLRLENTETPPAGDNLVRFRRPVLSRTLSYKANPYYRTPGEGGRRQSRGTRKSRTHSTRKKLNRRK